MGKQIRFFRAPSVERRLFAAVQDLGLHVYGRDRTCLETNEAEASRNHELTLGFNQPVKPWPFDSDFIQYSRGPDPFSARLWFDPRTLHRSLKSARIREAYSALVRVIKRAAQYHRASGLWIQRNENQQFEKIWAGRERDLRALVEENRKYAVSVLGAKLRKDTGA